MHLFAGSVDNKCSTLAKELALPISICQGSNDIQLQPKLNSLTRIQVASLQKLGVLLRQHQHLDIAAAVLNRAMDLDQNNESIALSLANVNQQSYRRTIYNYKSSDNPATRIAIVREGLEQTNLGLKRYLSLSKELNSESQIFAALNWLQLWSSLELNISDFEKLHQELTSTGNHLIDKIQLNISKVEKLRQNDARLSFAESLLRTANPAHIILSQQNVQVVIQTSSNTDLRLLSRAYGIRGQIYKKKDTKIAIAEFGKALSAAQSIQANELAFKWQGELARLYVQSANTKKAIELYEASLNSINQIRDSILQLSLEIQYDFRDKVEPIYREYIALLFTNTNPDIQKVVRVNEQLQIAELENYLQCSRLELSSLLDVPIEQSPDASLYIIRLPNRYAVVVRDKNSKFSYRILDSKAIDQSLKLVRETLQNDRFDNLADSTYQTNFGSLYKSLFKPIEDLLPNNGTLLIAADSQLQSIPWAMLFDGQQYLVERYAIAYSLGSQLTRTKSINTREMRILVAGLSEQTNESEFAALPNVLTEVEKISSEFRTKELLNEDFTKSRLLKEGENYPFIHFATHGQVSSDPKESFILGWNERITLSQLQNIVRIRDSNLELLVLSACEAAKGDSRAALGIAGSAYQAGAQSTIATLWLVEDESQSKLMGVLYSSLKDGKSKAESLREAQLSLLRSEVISERSPFLWGSAILLGSWN